ncbi:hypothetical protein H6P81_002818 [Aristolochia fimbriata]|uniref:Integrase catalytic domain-containing protein n=1 Tax=Aristolochia fimbriata TaxID=158543 RepID=A0AAV7FAT5_ARIFI|nr:hypothetical protein H6P81_002818 [Aristolochia fimbriata]
MGTAPLKFEINFRATRAIKGQALANFLADHPVPAEWELIEEFPGEEIFSGRGAPSLGDVPDGAARRSGAARVLFVFSRRRTYSHTRSCLLKLARTTKQSTKPSFLGSAWLSKCNYRSYTSMATRLSSSSNSQANLSQNEVRDWREPIVNFLRHGTLPVDLRERVQIRRAAPKYVFIHGILYQRLYEGLLLRCLSKEEGSQVLKETHSGICGAHQAGPKLHLQVKRLGYYWPSMLRDAIEMARTCKLCQLHADYIHQAPEPLHPTVASWPFEAWGMDIIGPISPKSDSDRQYILAATDYFSKWAEPAAYREVKAATVVDFIRTQIIYRYGVPRYIMTDNDTPFKNKVMDRFCEKFCIQQRTSTAYNPAANGLAEAFNKTLCKILKKTIGANKRSWDEKLGEALWAYRTSFRTPTQSTPFSLV